MSRVKYVNAATVFSYSTRVSIFGCYFCRKEVLFEKKGSHFQKQNHNNTRIRTLIDGEGAEKYHASQTLNPIKTSKGIGCWRRMRFNRGSSIFQPNATSTSNCETISLVIHYAVLFFLMKIAFSVLLFLILFLFVVVVVLFCLKGGYF